MKEPRSQNIEDIMKLVRPCPICGGNAEVILWRNRNKGQGVETPSSLKCSDHYIAYVGSHRYANKSWFTMGDVFITFDKVLVARRYSYAKKRYNYTVTLNENVMTINNVYSSRGKLWTKTYTDAGFARRFKPTEPDFYAKRCRA